MLKQMTRKLLSVKCHTFYCSVFNDGFNICNPNSVISLAPFLSFRNSNWRDFFSCPLRIAPETSTMLIYYFMYLYVFHFASKQ